jgi:hypothetical protein
MLQNRTSIVLACCACFLIGWLSNANGPRGVMAEPPAKKDVVALFSDNYSSLRRQLDFPAQRQLLAPTTITAVG